MNLSSPAVRSLVVESKLGAIQIPYVITKYNFLLLAFCWANTLVDTTSSLTTVHVPFRGFFPFFSLSQFFRLPPSEFSPAITLSSCFTSIRDFFHDAVLVIVIQTMGRKPVLNDHVLLEMYI